MTFPRRFLPTQLATSPVERLRASLGAFVGILLTGLVSLGIGGENGSASLQLVAPMGASAVLLFGIPASPLAQPWPVIGGNIVAALIGVSVARLAGPLDLAAAFAVALAFAAMTLLRCVHPPSGAIALTAVLGGAPIHALGYGFVIAPVALNSIVLTAAALAFNNATRRSYPHHAHPSSHPHVPAMSVRLSAQDLDAVLADYGEALDIGREDLEVLFHELLARAEVGNSHKA